MPAQVRAGTTLRFGVFQVIPESGELFRAGVKVKLQQQPLQLLVFLLQRPGMIVTREELRGKLWPTETFVDFEHGLNTAVRKIRNVLGDSAENPIFIETIPRKGYRFIAPVEASSTTETEKPASLTPTVPAETPAQPYAVAPERRERSRVVLISIVIVAGLLATFGALVMPRGRSSAAGSRRIRSLAVLPIENLSGDASQDFLADGMTEEFITELGRSSALRVISRTSVMQYKGTKKPVQQIARELNVDAVLEGTVLRSGNHVRITANLVQSSPETHLWAATYDSENGDILGLQQRVADSVAQEIRVALSPRDGTPSRKGGSANPEAQDRYFRGLYALRSGAGAGATQTAVDYFVRFGSTSATCD